MSESSNHDYSQQTQNICITFAQRPPKIFHVGPTLYKCNFQPLEVVTLCRDPQLLMSKTLKAHYQVKKFKVWTSVT